MDDFILKEDSGYLLLEDGSKIYLEIQVYSASISPSSSASASRSPSSSISASISPSASTSPSASISPSNSVSSSISPSASISPSCSISPSSSASPTPPDIAIYQDIYSSINNPYVDLYPSRSKKY